MVGFWIPGGGFLPIWKGCASQRNGWWRFFLHSGAPGETGRMVVASVLPPRHQWLAAIQFPAIGRETRDLNEDRYAYRRHRCRPDHPITCVRCSESGPASISERVDCQGGLTSGAPSRLVSGVLRRPPTWKEVHGQTQNKTIPS